MKRTLTFNFSEQAAFVCLMMRQRSENVLEFTLGNYFLDQLICIIIHYIATLLFLTLHQELHNLIIEES